jgi:ribonuclease BN (tRNA processing enzyme)
MARGTDLLLAEATHPHVVPADSAAYLSSAVQAGQHATRAGADRLVLTHLWPGTDPVVAREAATGTFTGPIEVARPGLVIDLPESLSPGGRQEMRA